MEQQHSRWSSEVLQVLTRMQRQFLEGSWGRRGHTAAPTLQAGQVSIFRFGLQQVREASVPVSKTTTLQDTNNSSVWDSPGARSHGCCVFLGSACSPATVGPGSSWSEPRASVHMVPAGSSSWPPVWAGSGQTKHHQLLVNHSVF